MKAAHKLYHLLYLYYTISLIPLTIQKYISFLLHGKNSFAEISKNQLCKRSANNFVELSRILWLLKNFKTFCSIEHKKLKY